MPISLSDGAIVLDLDEDMYWSDEWWSPVTQSATPSLTGAMIVEVATLQSGRPITLTPDPDDTERTGWMRRAALEQLAAWAAQPGLALTLTLRGIAHQVVMRHQDGAIEARPTVHYSDVDADDWYRVAALRFMEI